MALDDQNGLKLSFARVRVRHARMRVYDHLPLVSFLMRVRTRSPGTRRHLLEGVTTQNVTLGDVSRKRGMSALVTYSAPIDENRAQRVSEGGSCLCPTSTPKSARRRLTPQLCRALHHAPRMSRRRPASRPIGRGQASVKLTVARGQRLDGAEVPP